MDSEGKRGGLFVGHGHSIDVHVIVSRTTVQIELECVREVMTAASGHRGVLLPDRMPYAIHGEGIMVGVVIRGMEFRGDVVPFARGEAAEAYARGEPGIR